MGMNLRRDSNRVETIAVVNLVKTTFGPKGMDKILQSMGARKRIAIYDDDNTLFPSITSRIIVIGMARGQRLFGYFYSGGASCWRREATSPDNLSLDHPQMQPRECTKELKYQAKQE